MTKRFISLVISMLLLSFCLVGCGSTGNAGEVSSPPVESSTPMPDASSPEVSQPAYELKQVDYNDLSFEISTEYDFKEKDGNLSIVFEKNVATLTVSFSKTSLTDRETETTLIHNAHTAGFTEKQNEVQSDVDIDGVTSKATTCLVKMENTPWLNALCLTVPTETGNVTFLYLQAADADADYTDVFGALMDSIIVA
ncbi:MAG: hypothetical protein RR475_11675 [Clostridia bacterium]